MQRASLLRKALLGNAVFSTVTGLELLIFPEAISRFMGFGSPAVLRELGISLLFFAAAVAYSATRRPIRIWAAGLICALDVLWVVGTAVLLLARPEFFNTAGSVTLLVVAFVVADFAAFQYFGIRRLTASGQQRDDARHDASMAAASSR